MGFETGSDYGRRSVSFCCSRKAISERKAEMGEAIGAAPSSGSGDVADGCHGFALSEVTFTPGDILPECELDDEAVELLDIGPIMCCAADCPLLVGMCTTSQPIDEDELEAEGEATGGGATCCPPLDPPEVVRLSGAKWGPLAAPDTAAFHSNGFMPSGPLWAAKLAPNVR